MRWLPFLLLALLLTGCAADPKALEYRPGQAAGGPVGDLRQVELVRRAVQVQLNGLAFPDRNQSKPSAAVVLDRLELESPGARVRVSFPKDALGFRGTAVRLDGQVVPLADAPEPATPEAWPLPQALPSLDGLTPLLQVRPSRLWQAELELPKGPHVLEVESRFHCSQSANGSCTTAWWQGAYALGRPEQWARVGPLTVDYQVPPHWPHSVSPAAGVRDGGTDTEIAWNLRHPELAAFDISLPLAGVLAVLAGLALGAFVGHFNATYPPRAIRDRRLPRSSPVLFGFAFGLLAAGAVADHATRTARGLEENISWLGFPPGPPAWLYGVVVAVAVGVVSEIALRAVYRHMTGRDSPWT